MKRGIEKKWQYVMKTEGLSDWKIKIIKSGGGLCLHGLKEIWLGEKENCIPMLLHEIAHAILPKKEQHNAIWGDTFTMLIEKWWGYPKRRPNKKVMDIELWKVKYLGKIR